MEFLSIFNCWSYTVFNFPSKSQNVKIRKKKRKHHSFFNVKWDQNFEWFSLNDLKFAIQICLSSYLLKKYSLDEKHRWKSCKNGQICRSYVKIKSPRMIRFNHIFLNFSAWFELMTVFWSYYNRCSCYLFGTLVNILLLVLHSF